MLDFTYACADMVGWQAVEKSLCDLNPPSALGALALLIPVLLMHAMKAFHGGTRGMCFGWFSHRKESPVTIC